MPFLNVLDEIGSPLERRLDEFRVPLDLLHNPESLLPLTHLLSFLERNARVEGVADLGLRAAQKLHVAELGLFGRIIMQSASLNLALEKVCNLIPLYNSGQQISVDTWRGQARIRHHLPKESGEGRKYGNQFTMRMIIDLVRHAAGHHWQPSEIHLERGIDDPAIYQHLGARLREADIAALIIDPVLLSRTMSQSVRSDSGTDDVALLAAGAPPDSFIASIREVIGLYMRNDMAGIENIAAVIGMGSRSLQRRLQRRGAEFSDLVAEARLSLARQLLADRNIAVTDIAQELGYSDAANFTRAFRKWTGLAPSVYRARVFAGN